ncbi:MAG: hypothetical protein RBR20_04210 [Desulfobacterales bacterium]|jgi:hypothetical protein|nr:hypothetical protein [Desulfobacteraceae bacterium]MDD3992086.1 hypothetical protein [Desulfobacteraceae bacterium]MDY0311309.1 hypothetical protein [Desulfobacterales bacterium]
MNTKEMLYKKEIRITIIFTLLLLLMAHSASLFVLFPGMQSKITAAGVEGGFGGFPVQYIVPILLGWFGLAILCVVMALVCNKFDDEMEQLANDTKAGRSRETA